MRDGKSALVRVRGEKKRERARGANGGAEEQRSGVVLLIVSQSGREERGPDGVDIAREEHGDDGVSNTGTREILQNAPWNTFYNHKQVPASISSISF